MIRPLAVESLSKLTFVVSFLKEVTLVWNLPTDKHSVEGFTPHFVAINAFGSSYSTVGFEIHTFPTMQRTSSTIKAARRNALAK